MSAQKYISTKHLLHTEFEKFKLNIGFKPVIDATIQLEQDVFIIYFCSRECNTLTMASHIESNHGNHVNKDADFDVRELFNLLDSANITDVTEIKDLVQEKLIESKSVNQRSTLT